MKYQNAQDVLPAHLMSAVAEYVNGGLLYFPKTTAKARWGEKSGIRQSLESRNAQIRVAFHEGATISTLSEKHHLSPSAIKKIVYAKKPL